MNKIFSVGFLRTVLLHFVNSVQKNKAMPGNRMAETTACSPAQTSLRRHYPHQVQGVVQSSDLSAIRLPHNFAYVKSKLRSRK